jgi:hypothetical protein
MYYPCCIAKNVAYFHPVYTRIMKNARNQGFLGHQNQMRSHYNLNVAHYFQWDIITFQHILRVHLRSCPILTRVWIFSRGRHWALTFATIHEQPLPLRHSCGIDDLPIFATTSTKKMTARFIPPHNFWTRAKTENLHPIARELCWNMLTLSVAHEPHSMLSRLHLYISKTQGTLDTEHPSDNARWFVTKCVTYLITRGSQRL